MKEMQIDKYMDSRERKIILLVLMSGTFLVSMTVTITSTMLPAIMKEFQIATSAAQWLTSGATLVSGIMIPLAAFLIKRIPSKIYFIAAMVIFISGAAIAFWAPDFPVLLLGRLIQAIGCGILMPFSQVVLMAIYPKEKYGSAMALYSLGSMVAPVIAPSLSGLFIDYVGWQMVFLMLGVLGMIVLGMAVLYMKNVTRLYPVRLPIVSVVLSAIGLGGILIGLGNLSGLRASEMRY